MRDRAGTIVIGAGPAGLGAAIALGEGAIVLERAANAGGLCAPIELEGAVFDPGGHSFHTPHPAIRQMVFDALPMEEQARDARCYVDGEWIAYPFQKHFGELEDPAIVAECRAGLERTDASPASNLDEHLERRYGPGIARHFLRPYNEKLWGPDLTRLDTAWTSERMAGSTASPERFDSHGGARTPLQSDTVVAYPAQGAFGEIYRALARRIPDVRYGQSAVHIDPLSRTLETSGGARLAWEQIVSTLPLPALLALMPDTPAELRSAAAGLEALPLRLVLIALTSRLDTPMQRAYCAGRDFPGHKVVLNHNSSSYLRALPRHGILVEISGRDSEMERVISGLLAMGILKDRAHIAATRVIDLPNGYPVPTHERAAIVAAARAWLAERDIHTVGRFGEWAYINSDEALHRGLALGTRLCERTS